MFPSPIGELHFSITRTVLSVYLWPFPSPIGELHFSMLRELQSRGDYILFPSPIGELHFSIVRNAYWTKKTISVSVPYRGATFLNDVRLRGYDKRTEVSVPYRGATFLNHQWITHPRRMTQFPSPIGELHFSMMCISDVILYRICPSFRPLSGSYISQ